MRHIPLRLRGGAALNKLKLKGLRPFGLFQCKSLQERGSRRPCTKKAQRKALNFNLFAEREGFEPPDPLRSTVFKTAAFDHSAISPKSNVISLHRHVFREMDCKDKYFFRNRKRFGGKSVKNIENGGSGRWIADKNDYLAGCIENTSNTQEY